MFITVIAGLTTFTFTPLQRSEVHDLIALQAQVYRAFLLDTEIAWESPSTLQD